MPEIVQLSDPGCPFRIEYSRAAMEAIRVRAQRGLLAAPRVGMGVGGLLLGVRAANRVLLLDSIEIPCSHAAGPSFTLTAEERTAAREMVTEAAELRVPGGPEVVGLYCSKTRGDAAPGESDLALLADILPGAMQIVAILRPHAVDPMLSAFYFRNARGAVVKGIECYVTEWRPVEPVGAEAPPAEPEVSAAPASEIPADLPVTRVLAPQAPPPPAPPTPTKAEPAPTITLSDLIGADIPRTSPPSPSAQRPESEPPARPARRRPATSPLSGAFGMAGGRSARDRRTNRNVWLGGGLALLILLVAAYFTRDNWVARPALALNTTEVNGSLLIRWNTEAIRGIDRASMYVNDGGQANPTLIPLGRLELQSGVYNYTPKTQRVTVKLNAGDTSAISAWFAPEPEPPPSPATPGATAVAPATPPNAAPAQPTPPVASPVASPAQTAPQAAAPK